MVGFLLQDDLADFSSGLFNDWVDQLHAQDQPPPPPPPPPPEPGQNPLEQLGGLGQSASQAFNSFVDQVHAQDLGTVGSEVSPPPSLPTSAPEPAPTPVSNTRPPSDFLQWTQQVDTGSTPMEPAPTAPTPVPTTPPVAPPTGTGAAQPATQTTAELSGAAAGSGRLNDRSQTILSGAADIAGWLGDQGQKALQAILVTEGGMGGAIGDNGASHGPLQFYGGPGGGQLNNYARTLGTTLEGAGQYARDHPLEAIQWAIGTASDPGYLGAAIARGSAQGLSGADLATYAQRTGQVSVSPERAGDNYRALFGGGQDVVRGATDALGALGGAAGGLAQNVSSGASQAAQNALRASEDLLSSSQRSLQDLGTGVGRTAGSFTDQLLASPIAQDVAGFRSPVTLGDAWQQFLYGPSAQRPTQAQVDTGYARGQQALGGTTVSMPQSPLELLGSASPYGIGTAGEQLAEERNQAIARANPLRDVPVAGGATTLAAQAALDPTNLLLLAGPSLGRTSAEVISNALADPSVQAAIRSREVAGGRPFLLPATGAPDVDALATLRADVRRQAGLDKTPPAPPPSSAERIDYLTGQGKWAPPVSAQANAADKIMAVGVNGMLGGTNSMTMNALTGLGENLYRPAATAVLRGELGPAWADLRAQGGAVGDALADMASTFVSGKRPSRIGSTDYPEAFPGPLGALPITTGNIRANAAMDEFNRTLANAGAQAAELARLQKANPSLSPQQVVDQFRQQLIDVGTQAERYATFEAGGTPIGDALAAARRKLTASDATPGQRILGGVVNLLVPFSKIPDVILTRGVLGLPVAAEARAAVQAVRGVRAGGGPGAVVAPVWRAAVTEAVNGAIAWQVLAGNITGNGPSDPAKKAALMAGRDANGVPIWQPNSIRVPTPWGSRWIPYSSFGPIAIRMGAIANTVEQFDQAEKKVDPNFVQATGAALSETITDAWYLQSVGRVFQAMKNGTLLDAAGNTLLDFGERYVPDSALANQLRQYVDPTVRQPKSDNPLEYAAADIANRIPGLSPLVPARINPATGQPLQQPKDVLSGVVRSPAPGVPDAVNSALAQHNLGVPGAPSTITQRGYTLDLSADEQRQYSIEAGQRVAQNVQRLLDNPRWAAQSPEARRKDLQKAIDTARADAATIVWRSIPSADVNRRTQANKARQGLQAEPQFRSPVTAGS